MQLNKGPVVPDLAVFVAMGNKAYTLAAHVPISYSRLK
jgi:hypothetical protein